MYTMTAVFRYLHNDRIVFWGPALPTTLVLVRVIEIPMADTITVSMFNNDSTAMHVYTTTTVFAKPYIALVFV